MPNLISDIDGILKIYDDGTVDIINGGQLSIDGTTVFDAASDATLNDVSVNTLNFGDASPTLSDNGNYLRIQTTSGYLDIGANNTSYAHFYTDRPTYFFDKFLTLGGNKATSYGADLELSRINSATARLRITAGTTHSDQDLSVTGDVTISGDLTVSGTTTTLNTSTITAEDAVILLNSGQATPSNDIGLIFQRYSSPTASNYNTAIIWEEASDRFILGTTAEAAADADITMSVEMATINSAGVGVGTEAPGARLHTYDTGWASNVVGSNLLRVEASGNTGAAIAMKNANGEYWNLYNGGSSAWVGQGNLGFVYSDGSNDPGGPKMTLTKAGNLGIGTTTPQAPLQVRSTAANIAPLVLQGPGTNGNVLIGHNYLGSNEYYNTQGMDYSTNAWMIGSAVYVDSATSRKMLSTQDGYNARGSAMYIDGSFGVIDFYTSNTAAIRTKDTENTNIAHRMRISADGSVGIGTTSTNGTLHVYTGNAGAITANAAHDDVIIESSGNAGINLFTPNTSYQYLAFGDPQASNSGYVRYYHGSDQMVLRAGGTDTVYIDAGQVGIGTNNPTVPLHIYSPTDGKLTLQVSSGDSSEWNYINFVGSNGTRDAYIGTDSAGNLQVYSDLNGNYLASADTHWFTNEGFSVGTSNWINGLQVGSNTFNGTNGVYANNRVGISNHGALTSIMYASTYNNATYPDYGLVFVHGPSTSSYNVWSISPDGPAKGDSLNFIYGANATNIHTVTPKVVFDGNGHVGIGSASPTVQLEVYDSTTWDTAHFSSNTATGAGISLDATNTGVRWSLIAQGTSGGANDNNLGFHLTNAGTSGQSTGYKFVMTADGKLGIGQMSPSAPLHIEHTNLSGEPFSGIRVTNSSTSGNYYTGVAVDAVGQAHYRYMLNGSNKWQTRVGAGNGTDDFRLYSWTATRDVQRVLTDGTFIVNGSTDYTDGKLQVAGRVDVTDADNSGAYRFYQGSTFRGGFGTGTWAGSANSTTTGTSTYTTGGDFTIHHNSSTPSARFSDEGHFGLEKGDAASGVTNGYPKIVYPNCHWSSSGNPSTGAVKIRTPGNLNNYDMVTIEITVYEYTSDAGSKIIIGGHNWTSGGAGSPNNAGWHNFNVQVIGSFNKPIYLKQDANDRYIVLGDNTSSWTYGMVSVARVHGASFYSNAIDWVGDWGIEQTTTATYTWSTANLNSVDANTLRTPGYFRFATNSGSGMDIGRARDDNMYISVATTGDAGVVLKDSAGSFRSQWYGDNGTNYGFLGTEWGSWDLRKTVGGALYFNANSTYFLRPEGTSYLNKLGVGTDTASGATKLHVYGTDNSLNLTVSNNSTGGPILYLHSTAAGGKQLGIISNNTSNSDGAGRLQFWNASDGYTFATWGTTTGSQSNLYTNLIVSPNTTDGKVIIQTGNSNSYDSVLEFKANGSTITSEGAQLWYDNSVGDFHIQTTYVNDAAAIRFHTRTGTDKVTTGTNERLTIAGNGNVGIGITNPSAKLEVVGTAGSLFSVTDSLTGTIFGVADASGIPSIEVDDTGVVRFAEFQGNVLIGTATDDAQNKLQVDGSIMATGDVTAYASSDARLKTNLESIDNALDKVNSLTGYTFNWNERASGKDLEAREAGVIAQDVEKVLPEVVATRNDGYMAVKYEKLVPLLIEAIKDLKAEIEELKRK